VRQKTRGCSHECEQTRAGPRYGDSKDIPVIEILVKPGDRVTKDMPLVVLESDKATLDVPSPENGAIKEIKVIIGARVSAGSLLLTLDLDPTAADPPIVGLVVPVIRDVNGKGIMRIASEAATLAAQARDGKLKPVDMQGGCFTVSSLGGAGGTGFTPIINAPEVAILGVTRAQIRPLWNGKEFLPRLMLPLMLSWDHRAVDGVAAARFLVHLSGLLGDLRKILL
jgi:pyruvate/2-oxoglutarate dehydrogenase complex dihydrolipoamide acyltransferase (E2) component